MKRSVMFGCFASIGLLVGLVAPAVATTCNTVGCFSAVVKTIRVNTNGDVWFVVEDDAELTNLVPNGCVVGLVQASGQHNAVFLAEDDPNRKEKFSVLAIAQTTGQIVGFGVKDDDPGSSTEVCRLGYIYVTSD